MGVGLKIREHGLDQSDFADVLRDVRLYGEVGFFLQGSEAVHEFAAAAGDKAWGQDGSDECVRRVDGVDMRDGGAGVG